MYTLGAISLFVFLLRFVIFTFQESPKYLIGKGRDEDAIKVLHNVAKVNKYECQLSMDDFRALEARHLGNALNSDRHRQVKVDVPGDTQPKLSKALQSIKSELSRLRLLFSTSVLTRLTILVWVIYAFDYWAFSVAGASLVPISLPYLDTFH